MAPRSDLDHLRAVAGVGRDVLEARIGVLADALAAAYRRADEIGDTLTRAQTRCTELLEENRQLRALHGATPSEPVVLEVADIVADSNRDPTAPPFEGSQP